MPGIAGHNCPVDLIAIRICSRVLRTQPHEGDEE
jgi:hypothetical protein